MKESVNMQKSEFILNDNEIAIEKIIYSNGDISVLTNMSKCGINISLNCDINLFEVGIKTNISKYVYKDQNFYTEKYSYVILVDNDTFLTRIDNDTYLLELDIPKVTVLIPAFDNINKQRIELFENEIEIKKLKLKIYFNVY